MGQRHQVYAIVNGQGELEKADFKVVGIHHQWLYGKTALQLLSNALIYNGKSGDYGAFRKNSEEASTALAALYSIDHTTGYFHQTHVLDQETEDPRRGDNNDGITIIDFRGEVPTYCFMNIGSGDSAIMRAPAFVPLSAEQYVRLYYYPAEYKRTDWTEDDINANESEIKDVLKVLASYKVMMAAQIRKVFPMLKGRARAVRP